jgi:multidrug efflux system membrane fusion protein
MKNFKLIIKIFLIILFNSSLIIVEAREVNAKLNWFNVTELSFRVNGIVSDLYVKPGDSVKKNQKLINLDQREYLENLSLSKSLHKSRLSEREEARRELERAIELFDRTVLSEHELQIVKNSFISSETQYVIANTNLLEAKRSLEFSSISSPFNAIVLSVLINKNETVIATFKSSPAIVIAEADRMSVDFMLKATEVVKLKSGQNIDVVVAGKHYTGKLLFTSLQPTTQLYPVSIIVPIPFGEVFAGMDVIVELP